MRRNPKAGAGKNRGRLEQKPARQARPPSVRTPQRRTWGAVCAGSAAGLTSWTWLRMSA